MTVTLELSPDMAQKLRNIAQGQTSDAQATVKDLLAQVLPESAPTESDLLLQINALGLPAPVWKRYDALVARRQNKELTDEEHAEIVQIAAQIEENHVEQIRLAAQLARLQNKPLPVIMGEIGVGPRPLPAA